MAKFTWDKAKKVAVPVEPKQKTEPVTKQEPKQKTEPVTKQEPKQKTEPVTK